MPGASAGAARMVRVAPMAAAVAAATATAASWSQAESKAAGFV